MIRRFALTAPKAVAQQQAATGALIVQNAQSLEALRSNTSITVTVQGLHFVGAGLAAGALAGVGIGIGNVFGSLLLGCARQPNMAKQLFNYAVLGFALTEAIGLFALMLAFLMLFT